MENSRFSINAGGRLIQMDRPLVMGIINATPDSFYATSRVKPEDVAERVEQMRRDGADIIDVGACSTRPGSRPCSEEEEMQRLRDALPAVRRAWPEAVISVDTFRPAVARMAVQLGAHIINDVGTEETNTVTNADDPVLSPMMLEVAQLRVPYIMMARGGTVDEMLAWFATRVDAMHALGQRDIIIDPGFGFGRTTTEDLRLLGQMDVLHELGLPLLAGMSRKRMAWQTLGITPDEALPATTALNMAALFRGASILRVHDVKEAAQAVTLFTAQYN